MKQIIPHITEKAYRGIAEDSKSASTYVFKIKGDLDKADIKKAIETEYKVSVTDVRTINLPGKVRRFRNVTGKTSPITKAVVSLKKGDKIAAFDIDEKKTEDKQD